MIDLRIPCIVALSLAVTVACTESGAGAYESNGSEASSAAAEIKPSEVQSAIEKALDEADAQITPANAEDELKMLENEIDSDG